MMYIQRPFDVVKYCPLHESEIRQDQAFDQNASRDSRTGLMSPVGILTCRKSWDARFGDLRRDHRRDVGRWD